MEHWEVHSEGVAFARNNILSDHLIGPRVLHFAEVKVTGEDKGLDLVVSDLTGVELHNKILLERLHLVVFLQVREDLLVANGDLGVDQVVS